MSNPVVHFEITGTDAARLWQFYSAVFGWKINSDNPMNYGLVDAAEGGIGGGIAQGEPQAMFYIQVDDPNAHLAKIQAAGGRVVQDVQTIPGMVTFATFADPEGNIVGLVASETPPAG